MVAGISLLVYEQILFLMPAFRGQLVPIVQACHVGLENAITLSHYIWTMKEKGIEFNIQWKLIARAKSYIPATGRCNLCLKKKYFIIFQPHMASLNNRKELATECRHKKQCLFVNQ